MRALDDRARADRGAWRTGGDPVRQPVSLAATGAISDYTTLAQYTTFVQAEIDKFGAIIANEKLQMDVN